MVGVAVYMVIGLGLFIPMGFLIGFLQHKQEEARERENNQAPAQQTDDQNDY